MWADVVERAYEESELTFTFLSFMVLATLIASIGIILDSRILLIGAMVLGPEFGAVAALGLALVRKRPHLRRHVAGRWGGWYSTTWWVRVRAPRSSTSRTGGPWSWR